MNPIFNAMASLSIAALVGVAAPAAAFAQAQTAPDTYAQLDRGVYALVVKLAIKPGKTDEFVRLIKARIQQSRGDAAVVDFRMLASADPQVFYGFESFRSEEAFKTFEQSPESKAFAKALKALQDKPVEAQFLRPLP